MESNLRKNEKGYKHFIIEKGWCEKLFSFHRKVSLLPRMLVSQAPCFERQVVTQPRTVLGGVGDHTREIPTSKSQISAKAESGE